MKKFLALMLACLLVGQLVCMTASAEENTPYRPFLEVVQEVGTYRGDLEDLRYFPFRYTNDDNFAWFRANVIGPNECEEGVLYVKDLVEEIIWPVTDEPVTAYKELGDKLVYVKGNDIFETDYFSNQTHLYTAEAPVEQMVRGNGGIYFLENDHIKVLDTEVGGAKDLVVCDDVAKFTVNSDGEVIWGDHAGNLFQYDFATSSAIPLDVQPTINAGHISCIEEVPGNAEVIDTYGVANLVTFPLAEYPKGSYFTKDGGPCSDHHAKPDCLTKINNGDTCNCRIYGRAIQCMGFARYASDQYAHRSSWTTPAGDLRTNVALSDAGLAKTFYSSLSYGSYVELPGHSIVVLYTTSTSVHTYECNNDGKCGVSMYARDFGTFSTQYSSAEKSLSHSFNGLARSRSAQYHTINCSTSGCTGYMVGEHYSSNPGDKATCNACGYVGKIMIVATYKTPISEFGEPVE